MVVCDTPPVNAVADTSVLSRYTDGAILVVSHNAVTKDNVRAAKAQLEASNTNILGVVLSMFDATKTGTDNTKQYSYYNYNYSGGYGYTGDEKKDKE
jgi:Mrp family chromosome partitioning ATPase